MRPSKDPQQPLVPAAKQRRRRCLNCLNLFLPDPRLNTPARIAKGIEPKFCQENCRKEWHRNGGVSFARQKDILEQMVRKTMAQTAADMKNQIIAALRAELGVKFNTESALPRIN